MCNDMYSMCPKNILCALPIHVFLPSTLLATTDLVTVSIVLPFPECHVIVIIQYMAFSDFFPLSNIHLHFLHVF